MKKILLSLSAISIGCAIALTSTLAPKRVIVAQSLPYTLTVSWTASPDAVTYNCYLDGVLKTNVTTSPCQYPVATLGAHTAGVTAVNPTFVPNESVPATLAFTLKQPGPPSAVTAK